MLCRPLKGDFVALVYAKFVLSQVLGLRSRPSKEDSNGGRVPNGHFGVGDYVNLSHNGRVGHKF